ncbi:class I SAM-dependent methyltransferase [Marichromatium bheemlicum]|uniref:Methyltransferase n=1 Tax=Marichromatium bheemlicum TaxID=365339 RepID=A0ABX1I803_9GAMM|nr:class I SAM-dependent methyltransferase [Marichromatium bheemlicum]NKN32891.1 methyltransferase [Marichromatium bheemlicum]
MTDWTSGYVADIDYTHGYYPELNPLRMRLALLHAGLRPPAVDTACELGFGQGLSVNLHAAATLTRWFGTDFNPAQAAFAQELAEGADAGARLFDEAFAEFCRRDDLPDFDFIGLHGIWSWISDENRACLVDFLRRKLKVGGVLYVSYNTQPGWGAMVPMRDLLVDHAEVLGADGSGIVNRIDGALAFAARLLEAEPAYARANPQIADRLARMREQDRHYLAHEYFNRDWQPMRFAAMAEWLNGAKLGYACSAHPLDAIDALNLTATQQQLLAEIPDSVFRQTARDFCVNQQFRRDYWVKGARRLDPLEQLELLRAQQVVLVQPREAVALQVRGSLGEAQLQEALYAPVLDILGDHQPRTLGQLEQQWGDARPGFAQLLEVVMVLAGQGAVMAAQDPRGSGKIRQRTDRLNTQLLRRARSGSAINYLASPVTGGGILVPRFQQLFLLARRHGHRQPAQWAQFAWSLLSSQGQRILRDGQALESAEENLSELTAQAERFAERQLAVCEALQLT